VALQAAGVMEATPPNRAYKHRITGWLAGRAKASTAWLSTFTDELVGRASARYTKLHDKSFTDVEAAELVHSLSFQSPIEDTGADSKGNKKFDRFAVVAPCYDFDPNREFRLKFTWTEQSIWIGRKAFQKLPSTFGTASAAVKVQLRSEAVLRMQDAENAWVDYFAHVRGADVVAPAPAFSDWIHTANAEMLDLAGIFDHGSDSSMQVKQLHGFETTFACGTRKEMHDLSMEFTSLRGSFRNCVKMGTVTNEKLRAKMPNEPFIPEEVVIRVTFKSLAYCHKDSNPSVPVEETANPVYQNFASLGGCSSIEGEKLPEKLATAKADSTYRGMLLGAGLPEETLVEVLVDPADFLQEALND